METKVMRTFDNYFSANILLTRMQDAGINCYLKDEHTVTIDPLLTAAIGGIKLAVDIRQETEARILLRKFHETELREAVCPNCKKSEIVERSEPAHNFLSGLLSKISSNYQPAVEIWYECEHCGWKAKTLSDADNNSLSDNSYF